MSYYTLVKRGHEGATAKTSEFASMAAAVEEASFQIADIEALKEGIVTGPLQITVYNSDQMPVAHLSAYDGVHYLKEGKEWAQRWGDFKQAVRSFIPGVASDFKVAPFRYSLALILLFPALLLVLGFVFSVGGVLMNAILVFLNYGLSGLSDYPEHDIILSEANRLAGFCLKAFSTLIPIGGMTIKLLLLVPCVGAGGMFLLSAIERTEAVRTEEQRPRWNTTSNVTVRRGEF